ncbi:hypothetical protein DQ384_39940 [Sphaerisporangium album]|uniref:Uncharacterized protein n=1 Tax=Sphaerisporangium album TaxID=509200 RepID=A0A367EFR0_9ACTN|nr:hypothetical protein [Sphaerisporangium album]RCG16918.1 hypothetical protein DQ384_39940 [Sphaerisporangium album]
MPARDTLPRLAGVLRCAVAGAAVLGATGAARAVGQLADGDGENLLGLPVGAIGAVFTAALIALTVAFATDVLSEGHNLIITATLSAVIFCGAVVGLIAGWTPAVAVAGASLGIGVLIAAVTLAGDVIQALRGVDVHRHSHTVAVTLATLAVAIAGRHRAWRIEEFLADLLRPDATTGRARPGASARLRHAAGLLVAAIRFRIRDLAQPAVKLGDWFLESPRTEWLIAVITLLCGRYYYGQGRGWDGMMDSAEKIVAIAGSVASVLLWLRHRRGKNR